MSPRISKEDLMRQRPVLCVVGARPNYMKIAPVIHALKSFGLHPVLAHTGQHVDDAMFGRLFADLGLPEPDERLPPPEAGQVQSHAEQTARIMLAFDPLIERYKPRCVLVVGDVDSTLACALVAAKRGVPVVHVEAGLRSFDRSMPEEINRVLTDQLAVLHYTTEESANRNLAREGIDPAGVVRVGNVMIDSLLANLSHAVAPAVVLKSAGFDPAMLAGPTGFALATAHRPANVDHAERLGALLAALREASSALPVVFVLHPRTRHFIERYALQAYLDTPRIVQLPPQGYWQMIGLMAHARVVLTDSGGIQEETTALGVPCLTLRDNTERPITVEAGTNTLVGLDRRRIAEAIGAVLKGGAKRGRRPPMWDGHAASRIAQHLAQWLAASAEAR
ncbi:MAG: hypothetical protein RIR70_477 [Pseudomonadota bacterium]|jgi:UDP-N-acetylglucosamine 2-epimerase (non-hydrolysing)